jgi:pyruvate/2-oxoglutarate dehydrogenase complex dihydrolipoamide acyltransferase (E2) component
MPTITIRGHRFVLARQWEQGHQLTDGEAAALTNLFAENVRNNVDQWVASVVGAGEELAPEDHAALQARIAAYADGYVFNPRPGLRRAESLGEQALRELATERARIRLGLGPDDLVTDEDLAVELADPKVRTQAAQAAAIRRRVAQQALADL